jgi:diguanylate cyclase (GGDEF)-like protein/PAS domain S-box-containing protein
MEKEEFVFCITDNSPDAIVFSAQGLVRYVNPAAVTLFGAESSASLIGQPFFERVHPDYRELSGERIRRIDQSGARNPLLEQTYLRLDGSPLRVEVASIPFHGSAEAGALIFIRDISRRQALDEILRRERQFLRLVIDTSPNMIFVKDRDGRFLLANKALAAAYGVGVDAVEGQTNAYFHANREELEAFLRDDREVIDSRRGKLIVAEPVTFADGTVHWFSMTKTPLIDEDGQCTKVLGIGSEISELKQAQAELARSQDLLASIIDNTPAVIFVKDTAGRYLLVNQRYSALHHVSNDELRGRTDFDLFPPEVATAVRDADREVQDGGSAREFEEAIPMDDGVHTMLALKFPLRDASGAVYAVCGVATDITERKRSEAALQELYQNLELRVAERTEELRATEERLREAIALNANILATSTVGVMAYRQDGQCVLANPAAAELIGGSQEQLLAQNLYRIDSWRRAGLLDLAARATSEGRRMEMESRFTSGFGKEVWVRAQFSPFFSRNEPHLLLVLHDITEQRSAAEALSERERALRSLADNVPDNIARWDCDGELIYLNRALEQTLGVTQAEIQGKKTAELWPDGRFDLLLAAVRWVAASGESRDFDQIVPGPDGRTRYHMIRMVPETGPDGRIISVLGVGRDLTDHKRTEEQLRLAASVFHNSAEGVLITDAGGVILSVNPAFTKITGYTEDEAVGQRPSLLRSEHHQAEFYGEMWRILRAQGDWQGEIWNRRKNGEAYLQWMTINRIDDADGNPVRYVSVFHDITEMRLKDERIHHLAFHDALTGLPNRALMLDRLQHAINRCQREAGRLAVTFIDLDRFKSVNDGLGHDIGDLLLQEVAQRIEGRLRAMDTVARLGGDEFVVLMEDLGEAGQCASLAEQLIAAIRAPMPLRGHTVEIGASMGMAFFPEDGDDPLELMKRADMAMYAAKAAGRNTYRFFQEDMLQRTTHRLNLEMDLRRAIASGNLELHYQPKLALASGQVVGVEALVRWRHAERGLLPPGEFIPLAEDSGLIVELGHWVLDAACRQAATWRRQGRRLPIAVNISARQLDAGNLVEHISALIARHGIAASDLEIELTESTVMTNPASVAELLGRVRALGVTVAVDDFGTGYSSLAYLRRLPIDVLKIDRSFVMDADRDDEDAQIVRTIVALGQALRLTLVAEGIENQRQAELLLGLGCDIAQGYHYSPPLPADDLIRWLDQAE